MKAFLLLILLALSVSLFGQRYLTRSGEVVFFSDGIVEDITANSYEMVMALDIKTGEVIAKIPMESFQFKIKLMQEHFNENYVESHRYPDAVFKGEIIGLEPAVRDTQRLVVKGAMEIHGVKKEMNANVKILIKEESVWGMTLFPVTLKDHKIKIPRVVVKNIAEVVDVTVKSEMKLYE